LQLAAGALHRFEPPNPLVIKDIARFMHLARNLHGNAMHQTYVWAEGATITMRTNSGYDYEPRMHRAQMNRIIRQFILLWSIGVGLMDTLTGLLLVMHPEAILQMLGLGPAGAASLVVLGWLGAVVGGVGLSYMLALTNRFMGKAVWISTAVPHALAALVVIWQLANELLPTPWWVLALVSVLVAVVQITVVRAGWWSCVCREQFANGTPAGYENRMSTLY
jgi:hypothetical protein